MGGLLEAIFTPGWVDFMLLLGETTIKIVVVFSTVMLLVALAPYFERKTIGHMQVRMGPMRVGPHGILQPIADGVKLFFKEDIIPEKADKPIFFLSPVIALFAAVSTLAVVPFFAGWSIFGIDFSVIADINIGILYFLAMSSLGAYGIVMSGWSSNSKYGFLGGLRSSAQVISYEIAMGLSLVTVMMLTGSMNLIEIVEYQHNLSTAGYFLGYLLPQILGLFVFLVAAIAETNRTPFDLPEAESELVAGYFVEYSGFRFALFFVSEYMGMLLMSSLGVVCFLGGWNGPFDLQSPLFFFLKLFALMFFYFWLRATMPRYRYDQLMSIGWKIMLPLALANIVIVGIYKSWDQLSALLGG